jgi:hypothetical protein
VLRPIRLAQVMSVMPVRMKPAEDGAELRQLFQDAQA